MRSVYDFHSFIFFHFLLMKAVALPSIQKCQEVFGDNDGKIVHFLLLSSEFRNAVSLKDQLIFFKKSVSFAKVNQVCQLIGISLRVYYNTLKDKEPYDPKSRSPPTNQLLTKSEEQFLIDKIEKHQFDNDCLTSSDIRDLAETIFKQRTGIVKPFTRDWCHDFKERYKDEIEKTNAPSLDNERASISLDHVNRYISSIERILLDPPPPCLILNFDETGFSKRPEKGKIRKVFIKKGCPIKPFWRENSEIHHVSLVTTITAACTSLRPLCLSTRKKMDLDIGDTFFESWASYYQTPKGYMTQSSMLFWLKEIVSPYVKSVRDQLKTNAKCVIIADGCSAHSSPEIDHFLNEIGNIEFIFIPPHSSHISQMLDATIFGTIKRRYSSTSIQDKYTRFTKKLLRIKRAYQSSMNEELIRSGWEATGFKLETNKGKVVKITFNDNFKEYLRKEASKNQQNQ